MAQMMRNKEYDLYLETDNGAIIQLAHCVTLDDLKIVAGRLMECITYKNLKKVDIMVKHFLEPTNLEDVTWYYTRGCSLYDYYINGGLNI